MKARLYEEQRKYLTETIGIPDKDLPPAIAAPRKPSPSPAQTPAAAKPKTHRASRKPSSVSVKRSEFPSGVILVLIILAILLALIGKARGADVSNAWLDAGYASPINHGAEPGALRMGRSGRTWSDGLRSNYIHDSPVVFAAPAYLYSASVHSKNTRRAHFDDDFSGRAMGDSLFLWCIGLVITGLGALGAAATYFLRPQFRQPFRPRRLLSRNTAPESPVAPQKAASIPLPASPEAPASRQTVGLDASIGEPGPVWDVACATHKGNVRVRNEDAAIACRTRGVQLLALSDGCGGVPHGDVASHVAVIEAINSIASDLAMVVPWYKTVLRAAIERAMYRAAIRLAEEARAMGLPATEHALRATLILVAGGIDAYVFGYIGDGSGMILRADGTPEQFLVPQRADSQVSNVLAASLGPWLEGRPVFGVVDRHVGDLLIVTTDGVSDFVGPDFPYGVARAAIESRGDIKQVAQRIVTHLGHAKDDLGWICSDNLTIGLMTATPLSPAILTVPRNEAPPDEPKPTT